MKKWILWFFIFEEEGSLKDELRFEINWIDFGI
jgi:hypothetical protein